jgi:hypothetical protein
MSWSRKLARAISNALRPLASGMPLVPGVVVLHALHWHRFSLLIWRRSESVMLENRACPQNSSEPTRAAGWLTSQTRKNDLPLNPMKNLVESDGLQITYALVETTHTWKADSACSK